MLKLHSLTYLYSQLQIIIQRNTRAHTPIRQLMSAQSSIVVLQVAQLIREVHSELDRCVTGCSADTRGPLRARSAAPGQDRESAHGPLLVSARQQNHQHHRATHQHPMMTWRVSSTLNDDVTGVLSCCTTRWRRRYHQNSTRCDGDVVRCQWSDVRAVYVGPAHNDVRAVVVKAGCSDFYIPVTSRQCRWWSLGRSATASCRGSKVTKQCATQWWATLW